MDEFIENLKQIKLGPDYENETKLVEGGFLTSFDIIQIISMIRDEYDVKVPVSEIKPANFNSAAAIYDMVQRLDD